MKPSMWTTNGVRHSPPDTAGVDATSRRSREASFNGADGVVGNGTRYKERILRHFVNPNHPVCAVAERGLFIDVAATPPVSGGEFASLTSVPSFYDDAYKSSLRCFATASKFEGAGK
jgi:hypothetical protein